MPRNPIERAKIIHLPEDRQPHFKEELAPHLRRHSAQMMRLIHDIYHLYEWDPTIRGDNPDRWPEPEVWLEPARTFDKFINGRDKVSPNTIIKAKKILGIRSQRYHGRWYWTYPLYAPTENMNIIQKQRLLVLQNEGYQGIDQPTRTQRPAYFWLQSYLRDHGYDVLRDKMLAVSKYNKQTTIRMKCALNVLSVKIDGEWHWVYPAQEVQDWLISELSNGPVPAHTLVDKAAELGWSSNVVAYARHAAGGITFQNIDRVMHWRLK